MLATRRSVVGAPLPPTPSRRTVPTDGHRHRGRGAPQGVPAGPRQPNGGGRRPGPGRARGRGVRVPRAERRREDHHDPVSARPGPSDRRAMPPPRAGARRAPQGDRSGRLDRREPGDVPALLGAAQPRAARTDLGHRTHARPRGARAGRARRTRGRPGQDVLARHEAAARDRGRAAEGPRAADPRRARERARPRRDRRGARADATSRERGPDGLRLEPHPERGPADGGPRRDPGQGQTGRDRAGARGPHRRSRGRAAGAARRRARGCSGSWARPGSTRPRTTA